MENLLSIVKVLKPQGLKGEIKCKPLSENIELYNSLTNIICDNKEIKVVSSVYRFGYVYICLEGVTDCDMAEKFRNKTLFIEKENFGELTDNTYFIEDLVRLKVKNQDGGIIGDILSIENYGASDIVIVKERYGCFSVPFIEQVFVEVNVPEGYVVINQHQYEEHRTV